MKQFIIGLLCLLSFQLNAQQKEAPDAVLALFIATDQQNWDQVEQIFDEKVMLDYSSMNGNPATALNSAEITAAWKTILPGFTSTHHQIGNLQAVIDGNKASIFCYGTATHYLEDEGGNVWTVVGSYDFDLKRDKNKNWRISKMKFNFKYQDGNLSLAEKAINSLKED